MTNHETLGILGGTFDPPHYGHLALAENGRAQLGLDRVLFVPAGQQPLKLDRATSPAHHRAAMVEAAITDNPAFALSRVDLDRPALYHRHTGPAARVTPTSNAVLLDRQR